MTTVADEIAKLKDLQDRGALTDAEFEREKARLLRRSAPGAAAGGANTAGAAPRRRRKGLGIDILLYLIVALALPDALFQAKVIGVNGVTYEGYGVFFPAVISPLLALPPDAIQSELGIFRIVRLACILTIPVWAGVFGAILPRALLPLNGFLTAAGYLVCVWVVPALVVIAYRGGQLTVGQNVWTAIGLGAAAMGAIFAALTVLRLAASR